MNAGGKKHSRDSLIEVPQHITPSAQAVIKAKGLATVLDRVFQEIQTLQLSGPQIQKVELEWEKDPEVEGWEMLSVTLWCQGTPDKARSLWRELDRVMDGLRQKLTRADLEKLNRFVSVGVDLQ